MVEQSDSASKYEVPEFDESKIIEDTKKKKTSKKSDNKEQIKEDEPQPIGEHPIDVLDLIKKWDKLFDIYSFNNQMYGKACLHLLIGRTLINCRIKRVGTKTDPRISVLYLKPTFSGGSAGYDLVAKISREIGLKLQKIMDSSDAALIGSIEKHRNEDGENEVEETKGILDKSVSDIIYWAEPSSLFKKNLPPYQAKTLNYIQMALNPIDSEESKLEKPLKGGIVHCDCEASLMLVSYPPAEIDEVVLNGGFLHRYCFMVQSLNAKERGQNAIRDTQTFRYKENDDKLCSEVVSALLWIKDFGANNLRFEMSDEAIESLRLYEYTAFIEIEESDLTDRTKTHMLSIQASTVRKVSIIAMHHAAMRFTNIISKDDIKYAIEEVMKPQLESVVSYLESQWQHGKSIEKEDDDNQKIWNALTFYKLENGDEIPKEDLLKKIKKIFKITSTKSVYRYYNNYLLTGQIKEEEKKIKIIK